MTSIFSALESWRFIRIGAEFIDRVRDIGHAFRPLAIQAIEIFLAVAGGRVDETGSRLISDMVSGEQRHVRTP